MSDVDFEKASLAYKKIRKFLMKESLDI